MQTKSQTERKFYKTVIRVEVLSEDYPISEDLSLAEIHHAITEGDCSGVCAFDPPRQLTGAEAAEELMEQGSDPGFFQLNEQGDSL